MKFVDTNYIMTELYSLVESKLDKPAISRKYIGAIATFFNQRHDQLYNIAPYTNIYHNQSDIDKLMTAIEIKESEIINILQKCYFWNEDIRPKCVKEPYVEMVMCSMRYYLKHNDSKNAELTGIYLCFSGKFYASLYSNYWKYPVNPQVMDFVINNMLSDKYDLKKEGTVFGAIKKLVKTYIDKYKSKLIANNVSDDDTKNFIQQLRDREKSFLSNIFVEYIKAAENKAYLNYETDNLDPDSFRITDNDAAKAARITEAAMGILTSQSVSIDYCNIVADDRVKATQVKDILETIILNDKDNLPKLRRVINIMICDYMSGTNAPINSNEFLEYAIAAKPNTKNPLIIEMKQTILGWLEQDAVYRKRSRTPATANSYYSRILFYLALVIIKASQR